MTDTAGSPTIQLWDAHAHDRSFAFVSDLGRHLVDVLAPVAGEGAIDLGCGTGALAAEMADGGALVHGIDADPAMIAKARADHPALSFDQADGHDFTVTTPIDTVFSNAALHWSIAPRCIPRLIAPRRTAPAGSTRRRVRTPRQPYASG